MLAFKEKNTNLLSCEVLTRIRRSWNSGRIRSYRMLDIASAKNRPASWRSGQHGRRGKHGLLRTHVRKSSHKQAREMAIKDPFAIIRQMEKN